jgi:hypothetical protein
VTYLGKKETASEDCPLCQHYFTWGKHLEPICEGCPIKELTGRNSCVNTPYEVWLDYHGTENPRAPKGVFDDTSQQIALIELIFLHQIILTNLDK